jgi:hypothetical protein
MIDFLLLAVMGVVIWMVGSDGPSGAGITLVAVLVSGLVAMNFYEPVANLINASVLTTDDWRMRADIICLLGLFSLCVFLLRAIGEQLLPAYAEMIPPVYEACRWGFAVITGYVVMAIVCTSLHVAPLPRDFLGFTAERQNFFGLSPDRQWLGFTQYVSEHSMRRLGRDGAPTLFDGVPFPSDPANVQTTALWSSFPIRYGTRRQQYAAGGVAQMTSSVVPDSSGGSAAPQTPVNTPNSGTGGF